MVVDLFANPQAFFQRKARQRTLSREAIIVFVVGGAGVIGPAYLMQRLFEAVDVAGYSRGAAIVYVLEPLILVLLFWIGTSLFAHFLASFFDSRGRISRVFKLSAWALVPIGIGYLVHSAAVVTAYWGIDPNEFTIEESVFENQLQAFEALHMGDPVVLVGTGVLLLTVIWTGYLLSIAINNAKRNLSETQARIAAAVPTLVLILYLLIGLI